MIYPTQDKAELKEEAEELLGLKLAEEDIKPLEEKLAHIENLLEAERIHLDETYGKDHIDFEYIEMALDHQYLYLQDFIVAHRKGKHWEEVDRYEFELFYRGLIRDYGYHLAS